MSNDMIYNDNIVSWFGKQKQCCSTGFTILEFMGSTLKEFGSQLQRGNVSIGFFPVSLAVDTWMQIRWIQDM